MSDVDVASVVVQDEQILLSLLEPDKVNVEVSGTEVFDLIVSNELVNIDVQQETQPTIVYVQEQGPPGPSFQAERTDVRIAPIASLELPFIPKNMKFFVNGIKQNSTSIMVDGTKVEINSEMLSEIHPDDVLEFVYNYTEN